MSFDQTLPELTGLVFWLIPAEPHASFYRKEIERLSVRHKTTRFSPHLTVGRLADDSVKQQKPKFLRSLSSVVNGHISATHIHPECRMTPYQNLIHVLKSSHDLVQLQSKLQTLIPGYQPQVDYHVSLMYGEIPCKVLDSEIIDLSKRLPEKVTFSKISAIELDGQPGSCRTLWEIEI